MTIFQRLVYSQIIKALVFLITQSLREQREKVSDHAQHQGDEILAELHDTIKQLARTSRHHKKSEKDDNG